MARIYQASDTIEPVADTDAEQFGNIHQFGVISGCAVTLDAADMTYDVAAGTILHNGVAVAVAAQANAGTLVADGTNPRWATIYLDSTGTEGLVSGTAAADPSKPETGDNVELMMVYVAAGATVASAQTSLDKRVWTHQPPTPKFKYKTGSQNFTTTTLADVTATSGNMAWAVAASTSYRLDLEVYVSAVGTAGSGGIKWAFTGPAAPTAVYASVMSAWSETDATAIIPNVMSPTLPFSSVTLGTAFAGNNASNGASADGLQLGLTKITLMFLNGTTAGTLTLQAAQNTAAGTTTIATAFGTLTQILAE